MSFTADAGVEEATEIVAVRRASEFFTTLSI
jgi:hypothetical protein